MKRKEEEWQVSVTYDEMKTIIRENLLGMSKSFIEIGYYLKYIRDNELFKQDGFESIWEFAEDQYGIKRTTASRWMDMNSRFSKDGNTPFLEERYQDFGKSQLQEMLYLTDAQVDMATPEMTVKEVRRIKRPNQETGDSKEGQKYQKKEAILDNSGEMCDVAQKENVIQLQKPDERQRRYLNDFAKYFLSVHWKWFTEDHQNRVQDVMTSPKEIREEIGENNRSWYFKTGEAKVAHINLFDDYVQLWDEKCNYIGNFEWFYLAVAIQSMYNEVSFSKIKKQMEEEKCATSHMEEDSEIEVLETEAEKPGGELDEKPGEELDEELSVFSDIELLRMELEKADKFLTDMRDCFTEEDIRVRKQGLLVDALAGLLLEMEKTEQPEQTQPELPVLKNMEQRETFVNDYKKWPVWCRNEKTEETYYRYELPDQSAIVVREYPYADYWNGKKREGMKLFLLKDTTKHFKNGEVSMTEVKEHLKDVQKKGRS